MPRDTTRTLIRITAVVRAGWAGVLLLAPERVIRFGGCPPVPAAVVIARVLGARQLMHAAATAAAPTGSVAAVGAAVDALHGSTSLGLAAVSARWRRIALADAFVDAAFVAAGLGGASGRSRSAGSRDR